VGGSQTGRVGETYMFGSYHSALPFKGVRRSKKKKVSGSILSLEKVEKRITDAPWNASQGKGRVRIKGYALMRHSQKTSRRRRKWPLLGPLSRGEGSMCAAQKNIQNEGRDERSNFPLSRSKKRPIRRDFKVSELDLGGRPPFYA